MGSMKGKYILHIASWYPHKDNIYEGDFIQRHIECIAQDAAPAIVYFAKAVQHPVPNLLIEEKEYIKEYRRLYTRSHPISNYAKYHALAGQDINNIIKEHGTPRIIHCHASYPGLALTTDLSRKYEIPSILTEHSTLYMKDSYNWKEQLILRYIKKNIKKISCVCPVSNDLLGHMESLTSISRALTVPNVVQDIFFIAPKHRADRHHKLIHISSLDDEQKNVMDIVRAFQLIREQSSENQLTIVGNEKVDQLKREIRKLRISTEGINFLGPLAYHDIPVILAEHDMLILWSRYESFSLVIAEAWATGIPVVTYPCGGLTEEVTSGLGELASTYDPPGLAQAVRTLQSRYHHLDFQYIQDYAHNRYSQQIVGESYRRLYHQLSD